MIDDKSNAIVNHAGNAILSQANHEDIAQSIINFRLDCKIMVPMKYSGALRDLVLFVQFKKREKHPWRSVNFSKVAGFSLQLY